MADGTRNLQWVVGDIRITRVVEIPAHPWTLDRFWPGLDPVDLAPYRDWLSPYVTETGDAVILSVHTFVVEADGLRVIVDTCVGNRKYYGKRLPEFNDLQTAFLEDLAAAGFAASSIDLVVCTHLHMDHIGWNTVLREGLWAPTFPNARYVMSKLDVDYWGSHDPRPRVFDEAVQPLLDAGLVDMVAMDHQVSASITLVPTPGHSPGHVAVSLQSKGSAAFITGDMVHSPLQFARPEWSSSADSDGEQAERSRRELVARAADTGALVLGTHFPTPTGGIVVLTGGQARFVG